ncbi:MAG TPA: helix-turn-helix domain-containing protein [Polyangiaceae bacterium]|nr:helix-turn-helix domain-containing protein [Polyangiaceae bacterium]
MSARKVPERARIVATGIPFAQIPWALIDDPELDPIAKTVYCYLMRRARDGTCWPGTRRAADDLRISRTTFLAAVRRLEARGWVETIKPDPQTRRRERVNENDPGTTTLYVVHGDRGGRSTSWSTAVHELDRPRGTAAGPKPEQESEQEQENQLPPSGGGRDVGSSIKPKGARDRARRPADAVWDLIVDAFGLPTATKTQQRRVGRVVREIVAALRDEGIPEDRWADEVRRRGRAWPLHFEGATLTPEALVKHWGQLGRPPLRGRSREAARIAAVEAARAGPHPDTSPDSYIDVVRRDGDNATDREVEA